MVTILVVKASERPMAAIQEEFIRGLRRLNGLDITGSEQEDNYGTSLSMLVKTQA